jgi:hypothetical protein
MFVTLKWCHIHVLKTSRNIIVIKKKKMTLVGCVKLVENVINTGKVVVRKN